MDKTKIKYFYFDLDGTLLNNSKELSNRNLNALNKLEANGYKIGLITGRPNCMIKKELAKLNPHLPTISINGARIIAKDNKNILFKKMDNNDQVAISKFMIKNEMQFLAYSKNVVYYFVPKNKTSTWVTNVKNKMPKIRKEYQWSFLPFQSCNENILKFLALTGEFDKKLENKLYNFTKENSNCYPIKSQSMVMDIMPLGISKGKALKILDQKKIISLNKTITFGDANNDLSMFKESKYSVAMANATDNIKKQATYTTKLSNDQDGISQFIEKRFL